MEEGTKRGQLERPGEEAWENEGILVVPHISSICIKGKIRTSRIIEDYPKLHMYVFNFYGNLLMSYSKRNALIFFFILVILIYP